MEIESYRVYWRRNMIQAWNKGLFIVGLVIALMCVGCTSIAPAAQQHSSSPPGEPLETEPSQPLATPQATPKQENHPTNTPVLKETPLDQVVEEFVPGQVCSPLKDHPLVELPEIVSAPYAPPPMGKDDRHQGVDFSYYRRGERLSIQGVVVQSVLPGSVAASISDSFPFGNLVIIETASADLPGWLRSQLEIEPDDSLYILYAHLDQPPQVAAGERVAVCQMIGMVGKSGNAGIAHLHLETRTGPLGRIFPEMGYYKADSTYVAKENYLLWRTSGTFLHFDPLRLLLAQAKP